MTDKTTSSAVPGNADDQALDTDLKVLQQHWRAGASEQPPEALDLAVLRQARSALDEGSGSPVPRPWPWTRKWTHNLATAVVAVVAVALLLQLREQAPPPRSEMVPVAEPLLEHAAKQADAQAGVQADADEFAPVARPALRMSAPPSPPQATQNGTARRDTAAADSMTSTSEERELLPAEAWLAQIEALYASGDREAAQRELALFRTHYPDVELPAYLTAP